MQISCKYHGMSKGSPASLPNWSRYDVITPPNYGAWLKIPETLP